MQASCQIVGIEVYNLPCGPSPDDFVQHEEQKQPGRKPTEMKAGRGREKDVAPRGHMTCTLSLCLMQKLLNILTWSEGWQDNFRQSKVVSKVLAAVGHILQVIYILRTMCMLYLRSKVQGRFIGLFQHCRHSAYCILTLNKFSHSSPEAPRIIQMRETSTSEGGNYYQ